MIKTEVLVGWKTQVWNVFPLPFNSWMQSPLPPEPNFHTLATPSLVDARYSPEGSQQTEWIRFCDPEMENQKVQGERVCQHRYFGDWGEAKVMKHWPRLLLKFDHILMTKLSHLRFHLQSILYNLLPLQLSTRHQGLDNYKIKLDWCVNNELKMYYS